VKKYSDRLANLIFFVASALVSSLPTTTLLLGTALAAKGQLPQHFVLIYCNLGSFLQV
jgi:hypothetical protein